MIESIKVLFESVELLNEKFKTLDARITDLEIFMIDDDARIKELEKQIKPVVE